MTYHEFQKEVYLWLTKKHKQNPDFCFSVRKKATKGAESNLFIGTEKSGYFATTFWRIPVRYPGNSIDVISILFILNKNNRFEYCFQFIQPKNRHDLQNKLALQLIQSLRDPIKKSVGVYAESKKERNIEFYKTKPQKVEYDNINELFQDIEKDIKVIVPLVNNAIHQIKKIHPKFEAHPITQEEFEFGLSRKDKRLERVLNSMGLKDVAEKSIVETKMLDVDSLMNVILYGPPGTGKTYKLQHEYFEKYTERQALKTRQQLILDLVADLSWWEVIGATLRVMGPSMVPDLAKHEFLVAKTQLSTSKTPKATIWNQLQHHTIKDCKYVNLAARSEPQIFTKDKDSVWSLVDNALLETPQINEFIERVEKGQNESIEKKNYVMTTFHQNFSYEDFIEGIKPRITDDEESQVTYEIQKGLFYRACEQAIRLAGYASISECLEDSADSRREKLGEAKPYAFFIDEINRANVSAVFGELITLLEDDKRLGSENEITDIKLPYSKSGFGVPKNLHIIGTMNTADRSVEALDTALRRRFCFVEMPPNSSLLTDIEIEGIRLSELLDIINKRIQKLLDTDHLIGHSFFMQVVNLDDLKKSFQLKIIPLLQEYFYGDPAKIGLVLGKGFVEQAPATEEGKLFADFEHDALEDLLAKPQFKLMPIAEMENEEFLEALGALMNNK